MLLVLGLRRVADDAVGTRPTRRVLEPGGVRAAAQPIEQIVQSLAAAAVVGRQVFGQRDVGDGFDRAPQVVEDQQAVDHHQVRQRQVERVVARAAGMRGSNLRASS